MRYDEIIVLVDIDYLTSKQLAALLKELETDYLLFDNVHEKIYNKGSKFITDFVADLDEGDVSQKCLGILLGDYLQLNEDMLLNGDETAYTDFGAFADNLRALGVSDDTINKSIDPVTKALIDKVADLSKSNKEIEEEIAEVQEQLEEKQQAIDDKDKEIGEKSSEIDKLKKENEKNAADVAELEKKLKELEDEKAKTDAKIAEQEALVKKLQDEAAGKTDPGTNPSTDDKPSVTLKVGDTFVVGNGIYKITSADEVTLVSPKSDTLKSFTIEDTVKLMDGKDYKVTAIEANAFKENVKLTKVTIGANVAKIGKNAFNKCKKLKTITVNTELLTLKTVGSNAFKGIKKKATFKVPASMKKDYKKLFTKKGAKKPKIK
ncbi:MAG: leucine-rich repeat protein [Eubacterium sp.]|nr:leucine-rich repeat protein [Eubacterium sp.]